MLGDKKKRNPLGVVTRTQAKKNAHIELDEGTKSPIEVTIQEDTPSLSRQKRKRSRSRGGKKSTEKKSAKEANSIPKELEGALKSNQNAKEKSLEQKDAPKQALDSEKD